MLVLAGPSASGKSTLALALAAACVARGEGRAEIVNADSLQLYHNLPILTARPPPAALARVPHHLYGVLPPSHRASAGWYMERAATVLEEIIGREAVPILCGGSGLYLRALLQGLTANPPAQPAAIEAARARIQRLRTEGADLYALLQQRDPQTARLLAPKDSHRIMRSLEFFEAYGESWSLAHTKRAPFPPPPQPTLVVALIPPRDKLYSAIDARFERMLREGAIEEVRSLLAERSDSPLFKALGVFEITRFLSGEIDRAQMVTLATRRVRNYAKRQLTWLRHQLVCDLVLEGPLCQAMEDLCASVLEALTAIRAQANDAGLDKR